MIFETSAESLGNPAAFEWSIGSECDPVPIPEETNKTTLVVDYAPEQGYVSWPTATLTRDIGADRNWNGPPPQRFTSRFSRTHNN